MALIDSDPLADPLARRRQLVDALAGGPLPLGATSQAGLPPGASTVNGTGAGTVGAPQAGPSASAAGGGDPGAVDLSTFARRGGGTGSGVLSGAANMAGTGATIGSFGGPVGTAIGAGAGALAGALMGAFTKHASTAPTDLSVGDATSALQQEYQHALGRQASPDEIQAQLAGQGLKAGDRWVGQNGLSSVLSSIDASPEAQQYASKASQPAATATPAATPADAAPAAGAADYSGIPAGLAEVYKKHGISATGGQGAGFTDWGYWADKPSQWARLDADLSGTGPDQPGPKDSGAALGSGASDRAGGGSSLASLIGRGAPAGGLNSLLTGDPTSNINAAMQNLGQAGSPAFLQALLAAMKGGG